MARTQTVSDEEIFLAARKVVDRRGVQGFTLTDVAAEVGLSRAAIILRFKSTHALKVQLLNRMFDEFRNTLDNLPRTPGGDSLLAVAAAIGVHVGNRGRLPSFFANYAANMVEHELVDIERQRGAALRTAISRVMPDTAIGRDAATSAFSAHLTGTIMSLMALEETDPVGFLVQRSKDWLRLAGIAFSAREAAKLVAAKSPGRAGQGALAI